jgi:hypothetical protein
MTRSTIIFGNGLGMALDPEYFSLSSGLSHVWNNTFRFTAEHKRLVASALPGLTAQDYPKSEDQLDKLQMTIVASEFLRAFENGDVQWLSEHSRRFPEAFRNFIHEVASYFHNSIEDLPDEFLTPLVEYVAESVSHVATLNYDNLLYDPFVRRGLANGYYSTLLDGFTRQAGFTAGQLRRFRPTQQSWYLHLHGSPLFIENRKVMGASRDFLTPTDRCHIVLTHIRHKPSIIDASPILREYWKALREALRESDLITLFGYSGDDAHLNELLVELCARKPVHIIEWSGAGDNAQRTRRWNTKLKGCEITLHQLDNILDFTEWRNL